MGDFTAWQWFVLFQHELLLFAGVFFLIGSLDELIVDLAWFWLKLTGRAKTARFTAAGSGARLSLQDSHAIVFIPTWQEAAVIGATIRHALTVWPQKNIRFYIGCYRNDPETMAAVIHAARGDTRLRMVVNDRAGPTTKADCLNRLYQALQTDEAQQRFTSGFIVLHDAEDMVDPAALALMTSAMERSDLVQLPVLPVKQPSSLWISGHYQEEFAEAHGKAMVVRDAMRAAMPLAGVGCAISRQTLTALAETKPDRLPFSAECLTEDYELGLGVAELGGSARFIRMRDDSGDLIATRACFPKELDQAVRQKTRWIHGVALQGWDRLGWKARPAEIWMRLRDRRGPLTALVLATAYILLILSTLGWVLSANGYGEPAALPEGLKWVLTLNFISFMWRAIMRFAFTTREYGWREGLCAVLRIPVTNIIAIMAGRRALFAYIGTLAGQLPQWDKTDHAAHPLLIHKKARA
ncbi:glycosyl transferase family protein [Pontixanthobacter sp.]|uniref:glycosyl transferase family protein n=1 Tax=Pontixanthobacter sp. TaxID=2792078 RepID=UPI003C7C53C5